MPPAKHITALCPFCSGELRIGKLVCNGCDTQIETSLPIPLFFRLPEELQQFILVFLRCRGSIRDVEKELGISYPTVCKKLELVNQLLNSTAKPVNAREVLERVERGEITAAEAARILKGEWS
jgi:hypothetical protein